MIIQVTPRLKQYEPYDLLLLGAKAGSSDPLAQTWRDMMHRCYNPAHAAYSRYGAKGVSVCKRWHIAETFIQDAKGLYGWARKTKDWSEFELDKDYYSSNQYSPDTCLWLSKAENLSLQGKPVRITDPYGRVKTYLSTKIAGAAINMHRAHVAKAARLGTPLKKGRHLGYVLAYLATGGPMRLPLIGEDFE